MSRPADKIRDAKILAQFTGRNYHVLAKRYGLSERHVRRIVDKRRLHPRQPRTPKRKK